MSRTHSSRAPRCAPAGNPREPHAGDTWAALVLGLALTGCGGPAAPEGGTTPGAEASPGGIAPPVDPATEGPAVEGPATEPPAGEAAAPALPEAVAALELPDVAVVRQGVYVTTLDTPADYAALAEAGVATVIDLRPLEQDVAQALDREADDAGVALVRIRVAGPEALDADGADLFSDVVRKEADEGHILILAETRAAAAAMAAVRTGWIEGSVEAGLAEGRRLGLTDPWVEATSRVIETRLPGQ